VFGFRARVSPTDVRTRPSRNGISTSDIFSALVETKGFTSAVRLTNHWYVVCRSVDLGSRPISRTVLDLPLVLFRGRNGIGVFLDRCPHRNAPLSMGRIDGDVLQCHYHGWRFDHSGRCVGVPALTDGSEAKARNATAFPVEEQDGFVWVFANPEAKPIGPPMKFPHLGERGYTTVVREFTLEAALFPAVENVLDVPHTAFLHKGLFRSEPKGLDIKALVRRGGQSVEAEYVGEPRPDGLAARLLSPSGGVVTHFDRFFLPSIAQVEYRLGSENHFVVTSAHTPVSDFVTRMFAVVSFRLRLPGWLVRPVLTPIALRIFRQDAEILRAQSRNIQRFGGEQFASTEIDVLGPHILRLLKDAHRGETAPDAVEEHQVILRL
jgi:phenylpropionate dioxygenase-like ring-hydroxylating dioxygenase large terminal subunit